MKKKNFSLIEILAAIGIIAVLAALLISGFGKSKQQAIAADCLSNLRGLNGAMSAYTADHNSKFPSYEPQSEFNFVGIKGTAASSKTATLRPVNPYLNTKIRDNQDLKAVRCSSQRGEAVYNRQGNSYAYNESYSNRIPTPPIADTATQSDGLKYIHNVSSPARMIGFGEAEFRKFSAGAFGGGANFWETDQFHYRYSIDPKMWNLGFIGGNASKEIMVDSADAGTNYTMSNDL